MTEQADAAPPPFLRGGGQLGSLIRAFDWTSTPLGSPSAWPSELKTAVGLMLGAAQPVYIAYGPELTSLYNDGYLPIVGSKHPAGLGQPYATLWAEIWETFRPIVEATMSGEAQHFVDLAIPLDGRPGVPVGYFTFSYTPLRDDEGRATGFYCAATETTKQVQAAALRASDTARLRRQFQQMPGFVAVLSGPEHRYEYVNDAYVEIAGARDFIGRGVREIFPELEGQGYFELLDGVYATGVPHVARATPIRLSQSETERYIDFLYTPTHDEAGATTGIFVGGYDVTEGVRAVQTTQATNLALRERENFLTSVLAASTDCIKVLDLDGALTFMSEGGMRVMEIPDFNAVKGCPWPQLLDDEGAGMAKDAIAAARRGLSTHFETAADTYAGTPKWWSVSVTPVMGGDGEVASILSVSRDHTVLRAAAERQTMLNSELGHRLKNLLTIVQAIASQTLRQSTDVEEASTAISSRLSALGHATDVLTATEWNSADLGRVAEAALTSVVGARDRVDISGGPVDIASQSALALALALHELATNATKYGALSNDAGRVALSWDVEQEDQRLSLTWRETGGPPVSPPTRKGFGSRLIERSLRSYFNGITTLEFAPGGLVFRLDAPLASSASEAEV